MSLAVRDRTPANLRAAVREVLHFDACCIAQLAYLLQVDEASIAETMGQLEAMREARPDPCDDPRWALWRWGRF